MDTAMRWVRRSGVAVVAVLLAAVPTEAQWSMTAVGVAEYDTNETLYLMAGLSASPGGRGWAPLFGVQGSRLSYSSGQDDVTVWAFRPSLGVRRGFDGGAFSVRGGYSFAESDTDDDVLPPGVIVPEGDVEDGAFVGAQFDWWGTGGPLALQGIASYGIESENLWARGRVTTRLASLASGGQVRLGGEAAFLNSDTYSAWQPGGVLEWHSGRGLILIGGAGVKLVDEGENATYFKAEIVLPVR